MYPSRTPVDNRLSDSIYRMSRDQQFTEQAEAGMLPDLLGSARKFCLSPAFWKCCRLPWFRAGALAAPAEMIFTSPWPRFAATTLRTGDFIEGGGFGAQRDNEKFAALLVVEKVNGAEAVENPQRLNFDQMNSPIP